MSKTLWVSNLTGIDLNLSDISVTIKAGKTVNLYKYNPRLTEDQVELSLNSGILGRYTKPNAYNKTYCKILKKPVAKPVVKKKLATVTKTEMPNSVVVQNPLDFVDDSGFLSVDYGFDTSLIKISDNGLTPAQEQALRDANRVQNGQPSQAAPQKTESTFMVGENKEEAKKEGSIQIVGAGASKAIVIKHDEAQVAVADITVESPDATEVEPSEVRPKINVGKKPKQ